MAGKWALRIFPALENGPVRNNELLRRAGDNRTLVGLYDWAHAHWPEMERMHKNQVDSD